MAQDWQLYRIKMTRLSIHGIKINIHIADKHSTSLTGCKHKKDNERTYLSIASKIKSESVRDGNISLSDTYTFNLRVNTLPDF